MLLALNAALLFGPVQGGPKWPQRLCAGAILVASLVACDRTPPEPPAPAPPVVSPDATSTPLEPDCLAPWSKEPAPAESPVANCPVDPDGRPEMPHGSVRFIDRPDAPVLDVELAENDPHRAHGLMYRDQLSDDQGMLFSWPREAPRSFWMKNTCLSLDMMFIDDQGFIAGILEQVPSMNELSRRVPCPAQHVLEVRAGFSRAYGIEPGQRVEMR